MQPSDSRPPSAPLVHTFKLPTQPASARQRPSSIDASLATTSRRLGPSEPSEFAASTTSRSIPLEPRRPVSKKQRPVASSSASRSAPSTKSSLRSRPPTQASRPATDKSANSRPATSRPPTARSSRLASIGEAVGGNWLTAVIESRGTGAGRNVGMAAMERDTSLVILTQLSDTQTYAKTIQQLTLRPSRTILVPESKGFHGRGDGVGPSDDPLLVACLREAFFSDIVGLARSFWNAKEGSDYINQLLIKSIASEDGSSVSGLEEGFTTQEAIQLATADKYYALSACSALFKHLEMTGTSMLNRSSLKIVYMPPEGTVYLDASAIEHLDLLPLDGSKTSATLYGLLNKCRTAMASRMLKMNLLQPLTAASTLNARLDAVEEFVEAPERRHAIIRSLKTFEDSKLDVDRLIARLVNLHKQKKSGKSDAQVADELLGILLSLRTSIHALEQLKVSVQGAKAPLLRAISTILSDQELTSILDLLCESLNDDISQGKGSLHSRNAKVYAVKSECNSLLDVARKTYDENFEDIYTFSKEVADRTGLPVTLKLGQNGFFLHLKLDDARSVALPDEFVDVVRDKRGKTLTMQTLRLKKLDRRLKDSHNEVLLLVNATVRQLCVEVVEKVAILYKVSEAVALVDIFSCFADLAASQHYIRPTFSEDTLAIKGGRHPVLDDLTTGHAVPNDAYADAQSTFFLITGPNMSGKTTYLKQVALLTIMASVGSFVPARYANFKRISAVLTRLANDDDMESNLSTFAAEMKSAASILSLASPSALVLIDELGRGTSPREGLGIAHAISESLAQTRAVTFFATHFEDLCETLDGFPNVVSQHLRVDVSGRGGSKRAAAAADGGDGLSLDFRYQVKLGRDEHNLHYGLEVAKMSGLPDSLIAEAVDVAHHLDSQRVTSERAAKTKRAVRRVRTMLKYAGQLSQISRSEQLDEESLVELLAQLQAAFITEAAECLGIAGPDGKV